MRSGSQIRVSHKPHVQFWIQFTRAERACQPKSLSTHDSSVLILKKHAVIFFCSPSCVSHNSFEGGAVTSQLITRPEDIPSGCVLPLPQTLRETAAQAFFWSGPTKSLRVDWEGYSETDLPSGFPPGTRDPISPFLSLLFIPFFGHFFSTTPPFISFSH